MLFHEQEMPKTRSTKSTATHQELSWQGRLYAIRVLFTVMVLIVLGVDDAVCHEQTGSHFWLMLAGGLYPHAGKLLLGRFEGRRRGHERQGRRLRRRRRRQQERLPQWQQAGHVSCILSRWTNTCESPKDVKLNGTAKSICGPAGAVNRSQPPATAFHRELVTTGCQKLLLCP